MYFYSVYNLGMGLLAFDDATGCIRQMMAYSSFNTHICSESSQKDIYFSISFGRGIVFAALSYVRTRDYILIQ